MNPTLPLMTKHLRTMTCRCRSGKVKRDSVKMSCSIINVIFLQQMYGTRSPALSPWCAGRGTRWRTDHDRGRGAGTGNGNMTRSDHQLKYARAVARSLMKWLWKMFKWLLNIKLCMLCLFYCYINFLQEVHYNEQCKRLYSNL